MSYKGRRIADAERRLWPHGRRRNLLLHNSQLGGIIGSRGEAFKILSSTINCQLFLINEEPPPGCPEDSRLLVLVGMPLHLRDAIPTLLCHYRGPMMDLDDPTATFEPPEAPPSSAAAPRRIEAPPSLSGGAPRLSQPKQEVGGYKDFAAAMRSLHALTQAQVAEALVEAIAAAEQYEGVLPSLPKALAEARSRLAGLRGELRMNGMGLKMNGVGCFHDGSASGTASASSSTSVSTISSAPSTPGRSATGGAISPPSTPSDGRPALPQRTAPSAADPTSIGSGVERLKFELGMESTVPLVSAIARANEMLNMTPAGSLPEQVDRLLAAMGVTSAPGSPSRPSIADPAASLPDGSNGHGATPSQRGSSPAATHGALAAAAAAAAAAASRPSVTSSKDFATAMRSLHALTQAQGAEALVEAIAAAEQYEGVLPAMGVALKKARRRLAILLGEDVEELDELDAKHAAPTSTSRHLGGFSASDQLGPGGRRASFPSTMHPSEQQHPPPSELPGAPPPPTFTKEQLELSHFRLSPPTLDALSARGVKTLFPIQAATFDRIFDGKDLIARARTGMGKTLAFVLPVVERLLLASSPSAPKEHGRSPKTITVAPTRELAKQVAADFESIAPSLATLCVYGGTEMGPMCDRLRRGVDVVVGTPGRIKDLVERSVLALDEIEFATLDEADQMLAMGFADDMASILGWCTLPDRQTSLFSATVPSWVRQVAPTFMRSTPQLVDLVASGDVAASTDVRHIAMSAPGPTWKRAGAVMSAINKFCSPMGGVIVFCDTKGECDALGGHRDASEGLRVGAEVLHGDVSQPKREKIIEDFRAGRVRVIVATDVAARGLDMVVELVIQTKPPMKYSKPGDERPRRVDAETYVHRSGRTGRAGRKGMCVTLVGPIDVPNLEGIEAATGNQFERVGFDRLERTERFERGATRSSSEARNGEAGSGELTSGGARSGGARSGEAGSGEPGSGEVGRAGRLSQLAEAAGKASGTMSEGTSDATSEVPALDLSFLDEANPHLL